MTNDRFDAFISYFEQTGSDYAETIRDNLKRYSIKAFVAHVEKPRYVGRFEERINSVIANCRYFILLINIDTLGREQVIRECKTAYPNGLTERPKLVIFLEDLEHVERQSETFLKQTQIDISKENQHKFRTNSQLASGVSVLCIERVFVKETAYEPIEVREQRSSSDVMARHNLTSVEKFLNKVNELDLWKHFEIKAFLFKSGSNDMWKVQFLYVRLLEYPVDQSVGLTTSHIRLIHVVREIDELKDILYQITSERISVNEVSASLGLVPNKIRYDSFYKFHPQSQIFGVSEACYALLKSGNNSMELAENQTLLISEFEGSFDNLPDAIVNTLDLSFWDGTYAPFVIVLAPLPIEIVTAEISKQRILMTLNCSPLIEPMRLKVTLHGRNIRGRQAGSAISVTGFRRIDSRQISLDTNILSHNEISHLTVRLLYYDDLIQEQYFKKDQTNNQWVQN